jgi:patatin-related protein
VLDIISGTSAGGINGILLGYALANDCDPSVCENFWRNEGDILNLMHKPGDAVPNSVLDSQVYYQSRLEQAFAGIKGKNYRADAGDLVSPLAELDVFVTGTNVYGHVYTEFDDSGQPIDVKDHRTLFHLRKRIENDFTGPSAAYAKLSRITSAFPVAFEPVTVSGDKSDPADSFLIDWGRLSSELADGKGTSIFFLDGGILNNKPFSSTLGAIFHHTQTRRVHRYLLYVEPDPEQFKTDRKELTPTAPNVLQAAGDGLTSIPGYQSIAGDLGAIAEHNSHVGRYRSLVSTLNKVSADLMSKYTFQVPAELADLDGKTDTANEVSLASSEQQRTIYLNSRISRVRDRVIEGVLKQNGHRRLLTDGERQAARSLVESFNHLRAEQTFESLKDFDVYYRMRRLFFVADRLSELVNDDNQLTDTDRETYREVWRRINLRIKRLEILQSKMEELIDRADFRWPQIMQNSSDPTQGAIKIWQAVQSLLGQLLDSSGLSLDVLAAEEEIGQESLYHSLDKRVRHLLESFNPLNGPEAPICPHNLLLRGDADELEMLTHQTPKQLKDSMTQFYCRFIFVDAYLFPIQYMSEIECTDEVRTIRLSPIDARLGFSGDPRKRLCGNELGHFGGFLKASWRANDLMWGRLDGACQLIQCVVTPDRLRKLTAAQRTLVLDAVQSRCPHSTEYLTQIRQGLEAFADAKNPDQEKVAFDSLLSALIYAAQAGILQTEMRTLIQSSIAQQGSWNQYDLPEMLTPSTNSGRRRRSLKRSWRGGQRQPDRIITNYAAVKFAQESGSWNGVQYFRDSYDMADETWQNGIPRPVLVEIVTSMMLVFRKSLSSIGQGGHSAVGRPLFFKIATLPIWTAYYLTQLQRRAPEYLWNTIIAIAVLSSSVLIMDIYAGVVLGARIHLLLWIIPIVLLLGLSLPLWAMRRRYRPSKSQTPKSTSPSDTSPSKRIPSVSALQEAPKM